MLRDCILISQGNDTQQGDRHGAEVTATPRKKIMSRTTGHRLSGNLIHYRRGLGSQRN
jgi:hypothetical protein